MSKSAAKNVAIIGGGWAGMAAAVTATQAGHHATVFESSHALGGRARVVSSSHTSTLPDGTPVSLDNGQHILIGAYSETLKLMQTVGVNLEKALLRMPLTMQFPDQLFGNKGKLAGLKLPDWPAPWVVGLDAAWGIFTAKGWTLGDKWALLRAASSWQRGGFTCSPHLSVLQLCERSTPKITPRIMAELIEPLCLSALNTPMADASAQVFLRVLQDAMFSPNTEVKVQIDSKTTKTTTFGSANLLIPTRDLSNLFPHPAAAWLLKNGGKVLLGERVDSLSYSRAGWQVISNTASSAPKTFDAVILAGSPSNMAIIPINIAYTATNNIAIHVENELQHLMQREVQDWQNSVKALRYEAIATVYAYAKGAKLPQAMLALRSDTGADAQQPAQFVFDRGQLGGETGVLAFVISAAQGDRLALQDRVIAQGKTQLNLPDLHPIQTIIEKRATFACTPNLKRPSNQIAPNFLVCGDYVAGPYPATLEGAVRSAQQAVALIGQIGQPKGALTP